MARWLAYASGIAVILAALTWFLLPKLLTGLGLHPHYDLPDMNLAGRRALIVTTSHNTLDPTGKATGVWASELTAPYYAFLDSGMDVDVASIQGGAIPFEPASLRWPVLSPPDRRYLSDPEFQSRVQHSLDIGTVDIEDYDIVFLAGGWGAAYDFGQSETLGEQITRAYAAGAVVGGVCHGPLGLLQARTPDGSPLVEGRKVSAVSDKQIKELGISLTPMHPERDLRAAGALYESDTAFRDIFANKVTVDGRIVTGQNQNSGTETAYRMMQAVLAKT